MPVMSERAKSIHHERAIQRAAQMTDQQLADYLVMMADVAQSFTSFERKAIMKEAAKRLNSE